MDYRIGTCSQCGAEYKVPASFAHNQARCKKCPGTVNLGPAQTTAPAAGRPTPEPTPMPARKVVERPKPMESVDTENAESKRKERGTLAKLRAERAAAGGATPAATPEPSAKPTAKSEAPTKVGSSKQAAAKTPPAASASKRSSRASEGKSKRSRPRPEKKVSKLPLLLLLLAVVGGGGFAIWKYVLQGDDKAESSNTSGELAKDSQSSAPELAAKDSAPAELKTDKQPSAAKAPVVPIAAEDPAVPAADGAPAEDAAKQEDVVPDLSLLEPCKRARGTTDEQWEEMNAWAADFLDVDSGAAGPRAGKKLADRGRLAMPILINGLLTLDYTTEAGINTGDSVQRMLRNIANGNSFGWWYYDNPRHVYLCTTAAKAWHTAWKQVEFSIEAYIKLAKLEKAIDGDDAESRGLAKARQKESDELRKKYGDEE